jgi:hypothetical protein
MRCSRCQIDKPDGEFAPSALARRSATNTKGAYCRPCRRVRYSENIEVERARGRERNKDPEYRAKKLEGNQRYRAKHRSVPELRIAMERRNRHVQLMRWYGIPLERYESLLASQHGGCACCGEADGGEHLHVDHDHETGEIRGLLCRNCNTAIGMLGDTPEGVERALTYLTSRGVAGRTHLADTDLSVPLQ